MWTAVKLFLFASLSRSLPIEGTRDCRINSTVPWENLENVYTCSDSSSCCIDGGRPSCCTDKQLTWEVLDQVKLWASVICVVSVFGLAVACYCSDRLCSARGPFCRRREKSPRY